VARAALRVIEEERLAERSAELGAWVLEELRGIHHPHIREIRGRGLLAGIELSVPARPYCERLKDLGLLCKETHDFVIRLAPPLITSREDLAWMLAQLRAVFDREG
jgi:ornithine--oxo-acid transaminase